MANSAYRVVSFSTVDKYLAAIGPRRPEATKYLTALMNLEKGLSSDFTGTPIEGNYFRALQRLRTGDRTGTIALLRELVNVRPKAVRPRLALAFLAPDSHHASQVAAENPGSVEAWAVLAELGIEGAAAKRDALLSGQNDIAEIRLSDFFAEVKNGVWRHNRRFEYDAAWFENASIPHFPSLLKY